MITPRRFAAPSRRRIPASLLALLGALLLPTGAFALDHSGAINSPETWHAADNPHVVVSNVSLATGVVLTLEDGVEVRFNGNTRIDAFGSIQAIGTAGQGITLDRNTGSDWYGLRFYTNGGGNFAYCSMTGAAAGFDMTGTGPLSLDHVTITDGGTGVQCTGGTLALTSLHIDGMSADGLYLQGVTPQFLDAATLIENCVTGLDQRNVSNIALTSAFTIRGTTDAGLYLNNCPGATVNNVVFESCGGTRGAIWVENNGTFTLGAGNSIGGTGVACSWPLTIDPEAFPDPGCVIPTTGNTNNAIQVRSGNGDRTGTWPAFAGLDYVVTVNATIATAGNLTLGDGVTVRFNGNTRFDVFGTLNAAGTAGQGVTLDRNTGSDWYGLRFYTSGGGNFAYCSMTGAAAGFDVNGAGTLMLDHVTVTDGGYGIQSTTGALTLRNCRVFDNSTYGVYLGGGTMSFGIDPDQWNDIYDNGGGTAGRNLRNGPSDLTAAFVYWGSTDHATIKAGITDQEDNASLGLVTVTPFLNANHQTEGTGVDDPELPDGALPVATALFQNHPNPFNPTTTLRFDLKTAGPVRLEIFDLKGARVATLLDGPLPAGHQQVTWRGTDDAGHPQASGVYLYRLEADGLRAVRRMTLVR
ncbi:MAG: right-handed parallel beta-helix repeat-containing protein [Candidatus Krumholzibacteriia bacterium]